MKNNVNTLLKVAVTVLLVLLVYLRAVGNPFSCFDDPFIVEYYGLNSSVSFIDILTPGRSFYFRPIVDFTYWLDAFLWDLDPTYMHLENVTIHLINVSLIYLIASLLPVAKTQPYFPGLCALIFGVHPINSEPVNWIAGRADLMAGVFVYLAIYFLIRALSEYSLRFVVSSFCATLLGIVTKETAIMFVPAALYMCYFWPNSASNSVLSRSWRFRCVIKPLIVILLSACILILVVYVTRRSDNAISMIIDDNGKEFLFTSLKAIGFYIKKLFLPYPLNLAILEVNSVYSLLGFCVFVSFIWGIKRFGISGGFFGLTVLFILPAVVVAIVPIAWTPFGERYLYIPSGFAVIGSLALLNRGLISWRVDKYFLPLVALIFCLASLISFQRGTLWRNNLLLLEDMVNKSPEFGVAHNEYGVLLKKAGRYAEAEEQFQTAFQKKNKENVNRMIRLNLIGMKILGKSADEARNILMKEIGNLATGDIELLKLLSRYNIALIGNAITLTDRKRIVLELVEVNDQLYSKTNEPHYYYVSGQYLLSVGDKRKAAMYFRKVLDNAREDVYYREPARRLVEKIGPEK